MSYDNLCINCMETKAEGVVVCRNCGFDENMYHCPPHVLPPRTPLGSAGGKGYKYITGRVLEEGDTGITYIGIDSSRNGKVLIREFFMRDCMSRHARTEKGVTRLEIQSQSQQKAFDMGLGRFLQEAQTLKGDPKRRGIAETYDLFAENNTFYMVTEYLPGVSLRDYVRAEGRLSYQEIRTRLEPMMESLEHLHGITLSFVDNGQFLDMPTQRIGIIHCNISPDNIIVSPNGEWTLSGFGGCWNRTDENYVALEKLSAGGNIGPWADVYSMAATIYYCLCGEDPTDARRRERKEPLAKPSARGVEIETKYESALMKGLAVQYNQRYRTMATFQQKLRTGEAPNTKPPIPVWLRATAIVAIGLLAAGVLAAGMYLKNKDGKEETESETESEEEVIVVASSDENTAEQPMPLLRADGSMLYNGHCYMLYDINDFGTKDYSVMETNCENMGGHLAVINSEAENQAIYQYVLSQGLTMAFFGYSDELYEGTWLWVGEGESTYTNWADGQPNNGANNKNQAAENYAHFAKDGNGTWNDAPFGSNTSYVVCEWEYEFAP